MSNFALSNLLIGMARKHKSSKRHRFLRGRAFDVDSLVHDLVIDGYFRKEDAERVAKAIAALFEHSTPARKRAPRPPRVKPKICGAVNGQMKCELLEGHSGWHTCGGGAYGFKDDKRPPDLDSKPTCSPTSKDED